MKYFLFIIFHLWFIASVIAQAPVMQWQKNYGGSQEDLGIAICLSPDGGYLIASTIRSSDGDVAFNYGSLDLWLVKIDSLGNIIWSRTLGGSFYDEATSIYSTPDNGYLIFGSTNSADGLVIGLHSPQNWGEDGWLVKTDSIGQIQWQHCYGGADNEIGTDLFITSDSCYLLSFRAQSSDGDISIAYGLEDYWLVKANSNGNIIWEKSFGGSSEDQATSCIETTNNKYIIAGGSVYDFGGYHGMPGLGGDAGVVQVDTSGNILWSRSYGGSVSEYLRDLLPADNGSFYALCETNSNDGDITNNYGLTDAWVFKADSSGNILWQKSFGGSCYERPFKLIRYHDGGIVIAGMSCSNDNWVTNAHGGWDYWIFKLDSMGNFEWGTTLGGTNDEEPNSIAETPDGGFIVCGYSKSSNGDLTSNNGVEDVWVVKLSSPTTDIPFTENRLMDFTASQREDNLYIRFFSKRNETTELKIFDINGLLLFAEKLQIHEGINYTNIPCNSFSTGMYVVEITGKQVEQRGKVFVFN